MRFLRMLSNAVLAGAVAAAYVAALVLHLNPLRPLWTTRRPGRWRRRAAGYGVHLAALFYAIIVVRQLLPTEALSPGWFS